MTGKEGTKTMSNTTARRTRNVLVALAAATFVAGGGAAALAATSSAHNVPSLGISLSGAKLRVLEHSVHGLGRTAAPQAIRPGRLRTTPIAGTAATVARGRVQTPFSAMLATVTGAWTTSNGSTFIGVYVGFNPAAPSEGRVVILRQDILKGTQDEAVINTAGTGALTISSAPTGSRVETSSQAGSILLRTAHGRTLVLHLASNSIS
jgi:hypothetical protein